MRSIRALASDIEIYLPIIQKETSDSTWLLKIKLWLSAIRYGARPVDYLRFRFWERSSDICEMYLTTMRYSKLYRKVQREIGRMSGDKIHEYKTLSKYINRDWMEITRNTSTEDILSFINKHHTVLAKPNTGDQGLGVVKINETDDDKINALLKAKETTEFVIEECIQNHPLIAEINTSSLNTIRCYTFIDKNGNVSIMELMLRAGKPGSHVDNWGAGGVGYVFDVETGICCQKGLDKKCNPYVYHPGTNFKMLGFQLPDYEELKSYIFQLANSTPECRFVGWDIAITPKGYDLVEMNCPGGHDFLQAFGRPWGDFINLKSASNLNGNLNGSKELEHYAS